MKFTPYFLILLSGSSLTASTFTFSASAGPGTPITYVEAVGPSTPHPPTITETSTPCTTLPSNGCAVASLTDPLGKIAVPAGEYVQSASLAVYFNAPLDESGFSVVSVTPIDPTLPTTPGTAGNHALDAFAVVSTAAGNFTQDIGYSFSSGFYMPGLDYTSAVQAAVINGVSLAPISLDETLFYNFKTAQSAFGGNNSVTVFNDTFQIADANMSAILTVNFAPVPEPENAGMYMVGLVVFALVCFGRRFSGAR